MSHTSMAKFFLWGGHRGRPISPRRVQDYWKQRQRLWGSPSLSYCPYLLPVVPFELKSIKETGRERAKVPAGFLGVGKGPSVELLASRGSGLSEPEPRGGAGEEGPHAHTVLGRHWCWPGARPLAPAARPISRSVRWEPRTRTGPPQPPSPHPGPVFTACSFLLHSFLLGTTSGVSLDVTLAVLFSSLLP